MQNVGIVPTKPVRELVFRMAATVGYHRNSHFLLYFYSMQVAAFGCHSFALLFDDIDPELSEADQSVFSSSACAQVSITNEVYEHLGQPKFLFCPTGQLMNLQ